ncbi:MAG: hypothetical protein GX070_06935 [Alcaligenaceae bacterium]|nr:hypothetical protein [Alcaligenaceae bacterium]
MKLLTRLREEFSTHNRNETQKNPEQNTQNNYQRVNNGYAMAFLPASNLVKSENMN